jgi:hypothetical protein
VLDNGHLNYTTASLTFSGRATGNGHNSALAVRSGGVVQCSNNWCHGGKSNSGTTLSPLWTNTGLVNEASLTVASCTGCHGMPPKNVGAGGTALTTSHASFADVTSFPNATCSGCHTNMRATGTTYDDIFVSKSIHVDGKIDGTSACDGCHDYDVSGGTWGTVRNANYGGLGQGNGAHYKHIVYLKARYNVTLTNTDTWLSPAFQKVCGTCHSITEGTDHSMGVPTNARQITFGYSATESRAFGSSPLYNGNSGTSSGVNPKSCSNTDCHYKTSPIWSTY